MKFENNPKQKQTKGIKEISKVDLQNFIDEEKVENEKPLNVKPSRVELEHKTINVKPQNLSEIQNAMDSLIKGNNLIIDLSEFNKDDIVRILDFISGVCYCLNAEINKINEETYKLMIIE